MGRSTGRAWGQDGATLTSLQGHRGGEEPAAISQWRAAVPLWSELLRGGPPRETEPRGNSNSLCQTHVTY